MSDAYPEVMKIILKSGPDFLVVLSLDYYAPPEKHIDLTF
tara:strand:- start:2140 stop:2259 length:120 start_codon:yes stop_codon:yes gene_type:complete